MDTDVRLLIVAMAGALTAGLAAAGPARSPHSLMLEAYAAFPLNFEPNVGQADSRVQFLARAPGYGLFLTGPETVLLLHGSTGEAVVRWQFIDANNRMRGEGVDPQSATANYFLGSDPAHWRSHIPTYGKVRYKDVYPGIDVIYYANRRQLEYDLVLAAGSDPGRIRLAFPGARNLHVAQNGDLVVETCAGEIRQRRPAVYQESPEGRNPVTGRYVLAGDGVVGVRLGPYDRTRPLVIDPVVVYSTLIGGGANETGAGIAVDSSGNGYVIGTTTSMDFPVTPPIQTAAGGGKDVFIIKFNTSGSGIAYSTYLGGSGDDIGAAIAVDGSGNAYITGNTFSANFPTRNAAQASYGGTSSMSFGDAFAAKIDPAGGSLVYSTYLGGSGDDAGLAVAADGSGAAYVTGVTSSSNFPASAGAFRGFLSGASDAFVTKLSPAGAIAYSTYLGGGATEQGYGIAVDSGGNAYVTGATASTDFPAVNAFQPQCASSGTPFGVSCADAFLAKLNVSGSGLVYSTYLGGGATDSGRAIAVDASGNAYVAGATNSTNFPVTPNAFQHGFGSGPEDAFLAKFNAAGSALIYGTYLGGTGDDIAYGIAVDAGGAAYVAGSTTSTDFPTAGAVRATCGGSVCADAFVAAINAAGSALIYSTYLGGSGTDRASAIAADSAGGVYVTGETNSSDFLTTAGAYQTSLAGPSDAFVTKLVAGANPTPAITQLTPSSLPPGSPGFNLSVFGTSFIQGSVVRWNGLDRETTFISSGELVAAIPAADVAAAGSAQVTVFNPPPGGGVSNALVFAIGGNPVPVMGTILPATATAGAPGFTLVVLGSAFVPQSVVRWNGSSRTTTFVSSTQLHAAITAADLAAAGLVQVTVFNPAPGGGVSNAAAFTINDPIPALSSLSPPGAAAGGPALTLAVNGSNFVSSSVVLWNGSARPTKFISGAQLQASIPASDISAPGTSQITVFNPPPGGGLSAALTFTIVAPPVISSGGLVSAASFNSQPQPAGAIVALFGTNLAGATTKASTVPLPTTLGGVTVRLNGVAAPLFFVSPLQINFQIPWELQWQAQASLTVESGGVSSTPMPITLGPFQPAIFTTNMQGSGQGAILLSGTAVVAAPAGALPGSQPAPRSSANRPSFVEIYATGLGAVTNTPPSGSPSPVSPLSTTILPTVTIGSVPATVTFSGLAPGYVGLYQVNVQVPAGAPVGDAVPVVLTIGGVASNTVTMAVQ